MRSQRKLAMRGHEWLHMITRPCGGSSSLVLSQSSLSRTSLMSMSYGAPVSMSYGAPMTTYAAPTATYAAPQMSYAPAYGGYPMMQQQPYPLLLVCSDH